MAACCHGICLRLPHMKVIRWLSNQLKKLFRFCSKCSLFIRHSVDEVYCKCCGCKLRRVAHTHSARQSARKRLSHILSNRRYRRKHRQFLNEYNRDYYCRNKRTKQKYYRIKIKHNRKDRTGEYARYALRKKLLKIFFITLHPHLLL
jgi:predicted amidophosphoribosyltransferase